LILWSGCFAFNAVVLAACSLPTAYLSIESNLAKSN
jgi:hypothetical protein